MREIKFRAWNGDDLGYFDLSDICSHGDYIYTNLGNNFDSEMPLMQYTGLKDKNGTEIYEGDVVRIVHEDYQDEKDEWSTGKVVYNFGGDYPAFDIYIKTNRGVSGFESYSDDYNSFSCPNYVVEVIGNLYENPDLIKG